MCTCPCTACTVQVGHPSIDDELKSLCAQMAGRAHVVTRNQVRRARAVRRACDAACRQVQCHVQLGVPVPRRASRCALPHGATAQFLAQRIAQSLAQCIATQYLAQCMAQYLALACAQHVADIREFLAANGLPGLPVHRVLPSRSKAGR